MNLHHLRLFRAIAAEGSLTGAARRLNLSQSALSTQIKSLEASLGHDLFERRGRGLVLTEAGRIALDHADAIFRTAEDLAAVMKETGRARRAVRVGALATLSRNFQIAFLRPLVGRRGVEVVLRSGSQAELLRELDALALDVVLTNLAPPRDGDHPRHVHQIGEHCAGLHRCQLIRIADQQQAGLRAHRLQQPGHHGQRHHRGLVDDDDIVRQPVPAVVPEPRRGVRA